MKKQPLQLFIAYYLNGNEDQDAEIYLGKDGSDREFKKYWKMAYNADFSIKDINGIYPVEKEWGIDGKQYKITYELIK